MKVGAIVVAAGLLLAACGDDDGGQAETTATSEVPTTTSAPPFTPEDLAAAVCAATRAPGPLRLEDPELTEVSGLAWLPSGLWANNDSGDVARVFRIDDQGRTEAVVRLEGVEATDWEDLAGVAGDEGQELFAGDIGDNAATRPEITVHRFVVPQPSPTGEVSIPAPDIQSITLRYPGEPRDAETLLVDPVTRDLVIVHKRFGGASEVYQAIEADWSDGDATLERVGIVEVGDTPLDATTGGDVLPTGQVVALRTYSAVLVFAREEDQSVAEALVENPSCDAPDGGRGPGRGAGLHARRLHHDQRGKPAPDQPVHRRRARGRVMAGIDTFEFAFEPRFTRWLRVAGITPDTTLVTVTDDEFRVRFGGWKLATPIANCTGTCLTEGYAWFKAIGARGSLKDQGVTFGTSTDRGVCVLLRRPGVGPRPRQPDEAPRLHGHRRGLRRPPHRPRSPRRPPQPLTRLVLGTEACRGRKREYPERPRFRSGY